MKGRAAKKPRRGRHAPPFDVLYEDADVIVVDKPVGIVTSFSGAARRSRPPGPRSLEELVDDYLRKGQLKAGKKAWLVHRLDRGTSGVVMFAKRPETAERFRSDWSNLTEKKYLAKVEGRLEDEAGVFESYLRDDPRTMVVGSVDDPAKGKFASTAWRRLSQEGAFTLVEATLNSGRKNQIRVHFSEAGHPVAGDVKYGAAASDRLYLHSSYLAFIHPRTGRRTEVFSPCPFAD